MRAVARGDKDSNVWGRWKWKEINMQEKNPVMKWTNTMKIPGQSVRAFSAVAT